MRLREWLATQPKGTQARLVRETGLGETTVHLASCGRRVGRYETARKISEATGGAVSIAELCEPIADAEVA